MIIEIKNFTVSFALQCVHIALPEKFDYHCEVFFLPECFGFEKSRLKDQ